MRTDRNEDKFVAAHKFFIVTLLVMLGLILYHVVTDPYKTVTLKRESRSGYLPVEIVTVPYSDTMHIGDRIWYDGKMWTAIRFE